MNVYWLEQTETDVPAEDDWLGAHEAACLSGLRFAKRRADWRLGRWTAKCALSAYLNAPAHPEAFKTIEIRPSPSGAPEAFVGNAPAAVTVSLSHRAGIAICAVAVAGVQLGCDLETVEPRSDAFIADYFTAEEQSLVASISATDRPRLAAVLWSGKESALKALREGLRIDTRSVIVDPLMVTPLPESFDLNSWRPLRVRYSCASGGQSTGEQVFAGWWQQEEDIIRTVVAAPAPDSPIPLTIPAHAFNGVSQRGKSTGAMGATMCAKKTGA